MSFIFPRLTHWKSVPTVSENFCYLNPSAAIFMIANSQLLEKVLEDVSEKVLERSTILSQISTFELLDQLGQVIDTYATNTPLFTPFATPTLTRNTSFTSYNSVDSIPKLSPRTPEEPLTCTLSTIQTNGWSNQSDDDDAIEISGIDASQSGGNETKPTQSKHISQTSRHARIKYAFAMAKPIHPRIGSLPSSEIDGSTFGILLSTDDHPCNDFAAFPRKPWWPPSHNLRPTRVLRKPYWHPDLDSISNDIFI